MGNSVSLEEELINLRLVSKQMQRSAVKCQKNEKAATEKLKKAIAANNVEGARIYGQDAIREKNQALNHLRMASRLDGCCSKLETAVRMNQVTASMKGVVKGMNKAMASMNVEQLSKVMDKFEQQFEDLDVKVDYMDSTMNSMTATTTPVDQVNELIAQTAEMNSLALSTQFTEAGVVPKITTSPTAESTAAAPQPVALGAADDLEARLNNLRK